MQHSLVATVHTLTDFSHCYITEAFFPPHFISWCHLPCFSCITNSGLEVRSGLAARLYPSLTSLGVVYFLTYKMKY